MNRDETLFSSDLLTPPPRHRSPPHPAISRTRPARATQQARQRRGTPGAPRRPAHRALRALSPHVPSGSLRDPLLASATPPHGHDDLLVHRVHGTRGSGSVLCSSPRSSPQGGCLIEGADAPCLPAASHGWGVAVRLSVRAPGRLASRLPEASTGAPPGASSGASGLCVPVPHQPRLRVVPVTGAVGRGGYRTGVEVAPCRGLPHGRVGANRCGASAGTVERGGERSGPGRSTPSAHEPAIGEAPGRGDDEHAGCAHKEGGSRRITKWCGVPGEADAHSVNQPLSCTRQRSPRPPAGGFQQRTSELRESQP